MSVPSEKTDFFFSTLHLSDRSLWGLVVPFSSVTWLLHTTVRNPLGLRSILLTIHDYLVRIIYFKLASDVGNAGFYFKENPIPLIHEASLI